MYIFCFIYNIYFMYICVMQVPFSLLFVSVYYFNFQKLIRFIVQILFAFLKIKSNPTNGFILLFLKHNKTNFFSRSYTEYLLYVDALHLTKKKIASFDFTLSSFTKNKIENCRNCLFFFFLSTTWIWHQSYNQSSELNDNIKNKKKSSVKIFMIREPYLKCHTEKWCFVVGQIKHFVLVIYETRCIVEGLWIFPFSRFFLLKWCVRYLWNTMHNRGVANFHFFTVFLIKVIEMVEKLWFFRFLKIWVKETNNYQKYPVTIGWGKNSHWWFYVTRNSISYKFIIRYRFTELMSNSLWAIPLVC